jgi:dihydrofolate reductase
MLCGNHLYIVVPRNHQMKVTYYVAASIDGYIAKDDGDVSWLDELNIPMEKTGYDAFFSTVDALVMGRKTYEMICSFGAWPYGKKPTWICSHNNINAIDGINLRKSTTPEDVVKDARKENASHLWLVGGGILAEYFMNASLLTDIIITQMPIILGGGIPLFAPTIHSKSVELKGCKESDLGFVQLEYVMKTA